MLDVSPVSGNQALSAYTSSIGIGLWCRGDQLNQFEDLKQRLVEFARDRDWEQFHSPKNLSMALIVEAGELLEHFQWLNQDETYKLSPEKLKAVELELAGILIYLTRIAGKLNVDLFAAALRKVGLNEKKYPADKVRGSAKKYSEYEQP